MPEKILVVEDENHIRESAMRLLQRKGYETQGAASGPEALEMIKRQSFDLLLMDVKMPGMSGLETLRRAKEMDPEILALIITGYGTIDTVTEALELGAVGFVRKPITIDSLAKSIEASLNRGRLRKENARLQALMPLFELSKVFLSEINEGKLLNLVLDTAMAATGFDTAQILLCNDTGNLIMKAARGASPAPEIGQTISDETAVRASATLEPIIVAKGDGKVIDSVEMIELQKSGCDVYLPLVTGGKAIGIMKATKTGNGKVFKRSDFEFLLTLSGQSAIAIANARLFESLQKEQAEVQRLLKRVISTSEDERLRLSLELHDGPVQSIVASQYSLEACRELINQNQLDKAKPKLSSIPQLLAQSVDGLRRIIRDLHPPVLEKAGLVAAVQDYLSNLDNDEGIKCYLDVRGTATRLVPETERSIYYIVREAITNTRKHAEASELRVLMEFQKDCLTIYVSDNGKGFDHSISAENLDGSHLGLRSMQERATVINGSIAIDSKPGGGGTTVKLLVPINEATD